MHLICAHRDELGHGRRTQLAKKEEKKTILEFPFVSGNEMNVFCVARVLKITNWLDKDQSTDGSRRCRLINIHSS